MGRHKVEISLTGGAGGEVLIDGTPLGGVTGITLTHAVKDAPPRLTVDFILTGGAEVVSEVSDVTVPEKVRESLILLGWTPPDGA